MAKARSVSTDGKTAAFRMTSDQIEARLRSPGEDPELRDYFGEKLYRELKEVGRASRSRGTRAAGRRVLILPGIMGSSLGQKRTGWDAIWLNPEAIANGQLSQLTLGSTASDVRVIDVLPLYYTPLRMRLRWWYGHNADFFPYDWRLSLDVLGKKLDQALQADSAKTISLVAHSMGGLVCRAAVANDGPGIRKVDRIIMLGTPNHGSFEPVQVLCLQHQFVKEVSSWARGDQSLEVLTKTVFSTFPSLYQMLPAPSPDTKPDFFKPTSWPASVSWVMKDLLKQAAEVRNKSLPSFDPRYRLIAGVNQTTVTGVQSAATSGEFVYLTTKEGDGTVPVALAKLDHVPTWFVEESHGGLPRNAEATQGVTEILNSTAGMSDSLKTTWQRSPGDTPQRVLPVRATVVKRDASRLTTYDRRHLLEELYGVTPDRAAPAVGLPAPEVASLAAGSADPHFSGIFVGRRRRRLEIAVALGSLADVSARSYVLGLFDEVVPTGAASALDARLQGMITDFVERKMLDQSLGKVSFLPTYGSALPTDLITFVGLGAFGEFNAERQRLCGAAVIRALTRLRVHEFATVLLGDSVQLKETATATNEATATNQTLPNLVAGFLNGLKEGDPEFQFQRVIFCELDPIRFQQLKRQLLDLTTSALFDEVDVGFTEVKLPQPQPGEAARGATVASSKRPAPNYLHVRQQVLDELKPFDDQTFVLEAALLTGIGRAAVPTSRKEFSRRALDSILQELDTKPGLLDATKFKDFADRFSRLVLDETFLKEWKALADRKDDGRVASDLRVAHNALASKIPWEALLLGGGFPAIGQGLSRNFIREGVSPKWSEERRMGPTLDVLLVVNPTVDLPGAEREGELVQKSLGRMASLNLTIRQHGDATHERLLKDFRSGDFDVVHFAGHAGFDPADPSHYGLLCADGKFLTGGDLSNVTTLPTLIFLNACQSGRVRAAGPPLRKQALKKKLLPERISVAEAFLCNGVPLFLGTYWPVDDQAAERFAETFYTHLIRGDSIGSAVLQGRQAIPKASSIDWADYMLYGNPDFVLKQA